MEPTRDVVGDGLRAAVPDEAQERLLDEVVRGVIIADRGEGERLELRGMGVECRFDDRLSVDAAGATARARRHG